MEKLEGNKEADDREIWRSTEEEDTEESNTEEDDIDDERCQ